MVYFKMCMNNAFTLFSVILTFLVRSVQNTAYATQLQGPFVIQGQSMPGKHSLVSVQECQYEI